MILFVCFLLLIFFQAELPDVFADDGISAETVKEQKQEWTDMALQNLQDSQGTTHA